MRNGLRRMVTRVRLGLPEDSRRFADTELMSVGSTAPTSQFGEFLGVRHKDADLGDGVGAVAAGRAIGFRATSPPTRGSGLHAHATAGRRTCGWSSVAAV